MLQQLIARYRPDTEYLGETFMLDGGVNDPTKNDNDIEKGTKGGLEPQHTESMDSSDDDILVGVLGKDSRCCTQGTESETSGSSADDSYDDNSDAFSSAEA